MSILSNDSKLALFIEALLVVVITVIIIWVRSGVFK
jgi:hypothetical protein